MGLSRPILDKFLKPSNAKANPAADPDGERVIVLSSIECISTDAEKFAGFSNTDQDSDARLKHYLSIGTGFGADLLTRLIGPLGLHLRMLSEARTQNRHRASEPNTVRHELSGQLDAGLAVLQPHSAWTLAGWGELRSQWEPRDAAGRNGVDRQAASWGLHLGLRIFGLREPGEDAPADVPPDHIARLPTETRRASW